MTWHSPDFILRSVVPVGLFSKGVFKEFLASDRKKHARRERCRLLRAPATPWWSKIPASSPNTQLGHLELGHLVP
jgi:hypothetical protein